MTTKNTRYNVAYSLISCGALLALPLSLIVAGNAKAAPSANENNSVSIVVKVLTPTAVPEVYNTPTGLTQWRTGLPIPAQDTLLVSATIGNGNLTLTGMTAKLDGKQLPAATVGTWTESVPCSSLSIGSHELDITTTLDKRGASGKFPLKFTVVETLPKELVPSGQSPVVSSVKGTQQVFSQGSVASVDPADTKVMPPVVSNTAKMNNDPGIILVLPDDSGNTDLKAGRTVAVNGNVTVEVVPNQGSNDTNIVFAVVRDNTVVSSCSSLVPVSGAGIKLQARNNASEGLFPGAVKLYVWGVDQSGNYSTPTIASFIIK
jgi:hypothetical protein